VVQDLAGVAFSLGAAGRRTGGEGDEDGAYREAADQVRDAVRRLRSLLVEIYPPNLHEEGLEAALSDLMAKLEPRQIETSLTIAMPLELLGPDATALLYRAAQEALRNVAAHAEATRADVSLAERGGRAVLEVRDDGRGVDADLTSEGDGHFGLRALAGLAATMGATLALDSTPGGGTTLCLEVPIR